ncbi:helix-turn-helix domain-containing protein [Lentzea sp. HUAS12]|uniref:helix-turn-helix domain-containing protein n=1 Tax=Lentzea sp. HUAS12 TaxID=2951806 RepID=UPI00209CA4F0|nr:helix-turn-helix transcriptional regulator [Lentzea sp. HUAS12]USX50618.1 helix-turn-helix domain-containing protein [Lentzea sp. HUAS12]
MAKGLLAMLGYDENDPRIVAAKEDSSTLSNLVATLCLARHDQGLHQQDVAEAMGTTQSAVSNFERIGGDPKFSTILRYARAVGAKIKFLVTFDQEVPSHVPARAPEAEVGSFSGPVYMAANRQVRMAS